ncbi:hypothetical protein MTX20_22110 [Bradyrhizobium sp. ISRA435]|nr:hypothetical protein MTX20_22110 [Bradyrhizobium sp. ISRA435]
MKMRRGFCASSPRERERLFERSFTFDLATDVADDPAQPAAQDAQLPPMPLELLGMGRSRRRRSFGPVVWCFFGRMVSSDAPQNHGSQMPSHPKTDSPLNRLEACSLRTIWPQ